MKLSKSGQIYKDKSKKIKLVQKLQYLKFQFPKTPESMHTFSKHLLVNF